MQLVVQGVLFDERQQESHGPYIGFAVHARRQLLEGVVIVVGRQGDLLEVILALHACGGLTHLLHGGHEKPDQDRNNGDYHEQLDERESRSARLG